jgi:hypothetical protein
MKRPEGRAAETTTVALAVFATPVRTLRVETHAHPVRDMPRTTG